MPRLDGEGKALSIRVCTLPSHILFLTAFVYTTCAISFKLLHLFSKMRTSLLAAAGAEVHIDRVQVMHAVDA